MKKLDVSKILVLTAMTVTLMACGGTQTDQSEGLNQQDANSLKATTTTKRDEGGGNKSSPKSVPVAEGGGNFAEPSEKEIGEGGGNFDEGGGNFVEPSEKALPEGGGNLVDEGGGNFVEPSEKALPEGGGNLVDEGGGNFTNSEEQLKIAAQPLEEGGGNLQIPEGGGNFTAELNDTVLVLRGTMPKGSTEGLVLINGKEFYKLEITKDGSFVMKIELSDEDLTQMGFQLAFKDEVKNFIIVKGQIQEVIVKK